MYGTADFANLRYNACEVRRDRSNARKGDGIETDREGRETDETVGRGGYEETTIQMPLTGMESWVRL